MNLIFNLIALAWINLPLYGASSVLLNASATEKIVKTPGYPTSYRVDVQIRWNIRGPVGSQILFTFLGGNIESCCDYVELTDGTAGSLGKFTGSNFIWKSRISSNNSLQVFFSSDQTIALNGFRASYKAVTCGDNLRASKSPQSLSTPGWPSGYSTMQNCYWIIYSDNEQVQLTLIRGETEGKYDYIQVFNGNNSLAKESGKITRKTFSSTINELLVHFFTDYLENKKGVLMEYQLPSCRFSFVANESLSFISTPLFPAPYADNFECKWTISATAGKRIFIQFLEGSTESCCDIIKIKDPLTVARKLSGIITPGSSFISSGGELVIEFSSDNSDAGSGFNASYREADCGANLKVDQTKQNFSYSGQGTHCFWILNGDKNKQVQLKLSGRIEGSAYIEVFDGSSKLGRRNGNIQPETFISSKSLLTVRFHGDGNLNNTNFVGEYKENCGSVVKASTSSVKIESPPGVFDCTWRFMSPPLRNVSLKIFRADLRSCCDTLNIYQGQTEIRTFHNSLRDYEIVSDFGGFSLTLNGKSNTTGKKLEASVELASCSKKLVAGYSPSIITSPGWPVAYANNLNCEWVIEAGRDERIQLRFEEVDLETCCDFIQVLDGNRTLATFRYINSTRTFTSSKGGALRIVFVSDPGEVRKGFLAKYFIDFCESTVKVNSDVNENFRLSHLNYDQDQNCKVTFAATQDYQVWMVLNTSQSCCSYAKVYDGTTLLSTLKSNEANQLFVSRTGRLDIMLHLSANSSFGVIGTYKRFKCSEELNAERSYNRLSLAPYSLHSLYPNNLECRWKLIAPVGRRIFVIINQTDIESCCDKLQLWQKRFNNKNTSWTITGTSKIRKAYVSTNHAINIIFQSDLSIRKGGFDLRYKFTD